MRAGVAANPHCPVSTTKPWVKARRLVWGSRRPVEANFGVGPVRFSRQRIFACASLPWSVPGPVPAEALWAPVGSGRGHSPKRTSLRPRSGDPIEANFAGDPPQGDPSKQALSGLKVRAFHRGCPRWRPFRKVSAGRTPRPFPRNRQSVLRPVPLGSFHLGLAASAFRNPFAVPWAEALVPPDCCRGKWVRLPPRASSLELARRSLKTASILVGFSLLSRSLLPGAFFRFRSAAPGHTGKLEEFPSRAKRNRPVDK